MAGIAARVAIAIVSALDLIQMDIGACIVEVGTAALQDIGMDLGAIAATRHITAGCRAAAGNKARSADRLSRLLRIMKSPAGPSWPNGAECARV